MSQSQSLMKMPDVTEQLAIAGSASRAREARDQRFFVKNLFSEIEDQKKEILALKVLVLQVLEKLDAKTKKAEKAE